jgi:hypothetical protein
MRLTIIPEDKTVIIEGRSYTGMDLSSIDSNIHAIQWYDTFGIVEYKDASQHERIEDISDYSYLLDLCKEKDIELLKENKPSEFHVWDEKKKVWKEDKVLIEKSKLQSEFHIWDEKKKVWKEDIALKEASEIKGKVYESKRYLKNTDFYYIRKLERGIDVPYDVIDKRAEALKYIQDNTK